MPPERVVVGPAIANGLSGVESVPIFRNLVTRVANEGIFVVQPLAITGGGGGSGGPGGVGAAAASSLSVNVEGPGAP